MAAKGAVQAPQTSQQQPVPVQVLQGSPGSVAASSLFGLPGVTHWSEQKENLSGTVTTTSASSQVTAIYSGNFKQTDVVFQWYMDTAFSETFAFTGTAVRSAKFPYNLIGPLQLNFQNQFNTLNMPDGFCAALMQAMRPSKWGYIPQFMDQFPTPPGNINGTNWANTVTSNSAYATIATTVNSTYNFRLDLTPGILFNIYYDLEEDGRLYDHKGVPIKAWVTPQLMSGTNRVISPSVTYNQVFGSNADTAPFTGATITGTTTTTATNQFWRKAVYQPANSNDTPPVFNWQYSRDYRKFAISQVSSVDIPIPQIGQITGLIFYMWDPTLNSNVGGSLSVSNVKECDLIYGSGLFMYQDTPTSMMARFMRQHGMALPDGCLAWDMALTDDGLITNANALNTLTTSGCTLHIDFTAQTNAGAYGYLLIEALRYVSVG